MNQVIQGETSIVPFINQEKKRRGRPRKNSNLKHARVGHAPPDFGGKQEYHTRRAYRTDNDGVVGQAVTGVVQATFDAGYLLAVRIGNSDTNLRGVVFKPGYYAPITAESDVVPHLQMINRSDISPPDHRQGGSRSQKPYIQATGLVPSKLKYSSPITASSVPAVGTRGTVVPVVLQPVNPSNGVPSSYLLPSDTSQAPHMMAFGDKDKHMTEPSAILPPAQSIPAGQIFVTSQSNLIHQVTKGSEQNDKDSSLNEGTPETGHGQEDKVMRAVVANMPGSSQSADSQAENGSEDWRSSPDDLGTMSKQETGNSNVPFLTESLRTTFVAKPLFSYGTGRMTELLKAVQENMKDNPMQIAELSFAPQVEFHAARSAETDSKK